MSFCRRKHVLWELVLWLKHWGTKVNLEERMGMEEQHLQSHDGHPWEVTKTVSFHGNWLIMRWHVDRQLTKYNSCYFNGECMRRERIEFMIIFELLQWNPVGGWSIAITVNAPTYKSQRKHRKTWLWPWAGNSLWVGRNHRSREENKRSRACEDRGCLQSALKSALLRQWELSHTAGGKKNPHRVQISWPKHLLTQII